MSSLGRKVTFAWEWGVEGLLRFGHARVLTTHRVVIHCARVASLRRPLQRAILSRCRGGACSSRLYANVTLRPQLLIRHGFAFKLAVPPSLTREGWGISLSAESERELFFY